MALTLTTPAFGTGQEIPSKHTCESVDESPEVRWSGAPANTKSFALIVDDPDAPDPKAPKMVWVHWVLMLPPPSGGCGDRGRGLEGLPENSIIGAARATPGRR